MRDPHEPVRRDVIPRRTHTTIITQNLNRVNTPLVFLIFADPFPFFWGGGFCLILFVCYTEYVHIKTKEETMKRYAINYEETYSGTFTVELDDDSTEQDAIREPAEP